MNPGIKAHLKVDAGHLDAVVGVCVPDGGFDMNLDHAREAKHRAMAQLAQHRLRRPDSMAYGLMSTLDSVCSGGTTPAAGVAVGVAVFKRGSYGLALRLMGDTRVEKSPLDEFRRIFGGEVDVRTVGQIRPHRAASAPLAPGDSVGHQMRRTTGTLGAFARERNGDNRFVLSNNHVLADSGRVSIGEDIIHPGPHDAGPHVSIGTLARVVPLRVGGAINTVDAALCALRDDVSIANHFAGHDLVGVGEPAEEMVVHKIGRTTGVTLGIVTAIEMDEVRVNYGHLGILRFDGQIEVQGAEGGIFSAPGDSGSLVHCPGTKSAIGLLFAGSDRGGPADSGLTYVNPIGVVLDALDVDLV